MESKKIIAILGPTAVGKSSVAFSLAKKLGCSIISGDSRQLYSEMSIGTAKPTQEQRKEVPHHFIGSHTIKRPLSAAEFENEFLALLNKLPDKTYVLTGGSGLFVKAAIEGLNPIPHDEAVRIALEQEYEQKGLDYLLEKLAEVDPVSYENIDTNNPRRVIRALEVYQSSSKSLSWWKKHSEKKPRNFNTQVFVLTRTRAALHQRINQRVDLMIEKGLEHEAEKLYALRDKKALQTVGYQEWWPFFEGNRSKEEVVRLIKRNSRRYAKRQMTWLNNQLGEHKNIVGVDGKDELEVANEIVKFN